MSAACSSLLAQGCTAAHVQRAAAPLPAMLRLRRALAPSARRGVTSWTRGRGVTVQAGGWGAPVTFHPARIVSSTRAAEGLQSLMVEVPSVVAAGYSTPGQYLQVRVSANDKPAFLALASAVGAHGGAVELLIKPQAGTTAALCELPAGAALEVSEAQGRGFQTAALPVGDVPHVLLFATGSGLSPMRALLETPARLGGLAQALSSIHLYVGVRTPAHLPFAQQLDAWERAGMRVTRVYSQHATGAHAQYVQEVFAAAGE